MHSLLQVHLVFVENPSWKRVRYATIRGDSYEFISKYFLLIVVNVDESVTNISRVYFLDFIISSHFSKKKL